MTADVSNNGVLLLLLLLLVRAAVVTTFSFDGYGIGCCADAAADDCFGNGGATIAVSKDCNVFLLSIICPLGKRNKVATASSLAAFAVVTRAGGLPL